MAFNLQLVLEALLFSSSQPLTVKDIQAIFTRFHEQAGKPPTAAGSEGAPAGDAASGETPPASDDAPASAGAAPAGDGVASEPAETPVFPAHETDPELYSGVPSLVTATQIREAMDALAQRLRDAGGIYLLIEGAQGYRIVLQPRFARWVRVLRNEPPPVKLSQSALETLAVVAYRQPVTRTEIEHIRGVSAEAGLNKLTERELVYIMGRADLPGRPLQYGTTDKFLEFIGLKSLDELPASDVLSPRQVDEWLQRAMNPHVPDDADMGLPLEPADAVPAESDAAPAAEEKMEGRG